MLSAKQGNQPLYSQVAKEIKTDIIQKKYKSNEKLLTEKELCAYFGVSRVTIRRSLKELEHQGVVDIVHGKGTFVKSNKQSVHLINMNGFSDGLESSSYDINKRIISKKIILSDDFLCRVFDKDNSFNVIELIRVIGDNEGDFCLDYSYIPCDIYPNIFEKIKTGTSTYKLMKSYGVLFENTKKDISIMFSNKEISDLLNITRYHPLFKIEKTIQDSKNTCVHYSNYFLLEDRVNLSVST